MLPNNFITEFLLAVLEELRIFYITNEYDSSTNIMTKKYKVLGVTVKEERYNTFRK